jgi:acyl dehydratase
VKSNLSQNSNRSVGTQVASSDWISISQERVNTFADATGDHQWIHIDVERAKKESPFGGPIAHGFLTLSLLPMLMADALHLSYVKMGVNYGLNKVRFPAPVPVGSRART